VAKRKQFLLRLDPLLWEEIERWAQEELRSANGQIEFLLREAVRSRRRKSLPEPEPEADEGELESEQ
jgi:hypothetical protein